MRPAAILAGCCLFSGNPTVTITGPSTATVGTAVTFTAVATGGSGPYTFAWTFGGSGSTATHTFQSAGTHTIGVTVTDNCGRSATVTGSVTVTDNLTGMWHGTLYEQGDPFEFQLQLTHVGTTVTGTVFIVGASSPGSGSYAAGQFVFQFMLPGTAVSVFLRGTYNPPADTLSGEWLIGGMNLGTWTVRR